MMILQTYSVECVEKLMAENEHLRTALEEIALRKHSDAPAEVMAIEALKPYSDSLMETVKERIADPKIVKVDFDSL